VARDEGQLAGKLFRFELCLQCIPENGG